MRPDAYVCPHCGRGRDHSRLLADGIERAVNRSALAESWRPVLPVFYAPGEGRPNAPVRGLVTWLPGEREPFGRLSLLIEAERMLGADPVYTTTLRALASLIDKAIRPGDDVSGVPGLAGCEAPDVRIVDRDGDAVMVLCMAWEGKLISTVVAEAA